MTDTTTPQPPADHDPHLWLEEVDGQEALDWVDRRSRRAEEELTAHDLYPALHDGIRSALEASDRIPRCRRRPLARWVRADRR